MRNKTPVYVTCVAIAALVWGTINYVVAPEVRAGGVDDVLILCGLAITAEALSYLLPKAATGSISFIPYFAAAIIAPNWTSVLSVVAVKTLVEAWRRKAPIKAVLNVSAYALMQLVAITVYTGFGGVALRELERMSLTQVTRL